ncbi:MAG: hypothetical protein ACYC2O_14260, partial [Microthrixaceae bacterium]
PRTAARATNRTTPVERTRSRGVVRPLPQETAGPRLRVFPRRVVSLRALVLVSGVLFFGVLFGAVAIQAQRIEGQRQIDRLDREISEQRDLNRSLRAAVAEQESPERIMAEARALDMVEPGPVVPLVAGVPLEPVDQVPTEETTADSVPSTTGAEDLGR